MTDTDTNLGASSYIPTHAQTSEKTLFRKLFGVPVSPYALVLDQQQHFQSWLETLSEQDERICAFTNTSTILFTGTQLYASATGITLRRWSV